MIQEFGFRFGQALIFSFQVNTPTNIKRIALQRLLRLRMFSFRNLFQKINTEIGSLIGREWLSKQS